jgi:hypothetical protein
MRYRRLKLWRPLDGDVRLKVDDPHPVHGRDMSATTTDVALDLIVAEPELVGFVVTHPLLAAMTDAPAGVRSARV